MGVGGRVCKAVGAAGRTGGGADCFRGSCSQTLSVSPTHGFPQSVQGPGHDDSVRAGTHSLAWGAGDGGGGGTERKAHAERTRDFLERRLLLYFDSPVNLLSPKRVK